MARSQYVYVALRDGQAAPAGTFTVKHELVTWLTRAASLEGLSVWRCRDAYDQPGPALIPLDQLIRGAH